MNVERYSMNKRGKNEKRKPPFILLGTFGEKERGRGRNKKGMKRQNSGEPLLCAATVCLYATAALLRVPPLSDT